MKTKYPIAINFIGFQVGWFACVLSAAQNKPEIGIIISLLIVALHIYIMENRQMILTLLVAATLMGSAWDSILTSNQILVFSSGMMSSYLAPSWIIMMWLIFSTTLTISFRWLYRRYWLAMVLGAIFGPLTYQAGAALGAVIIPNPILANIVLMIGWAILFPLLIKTAEIFQEKNLLRSI